MQKLAETALRMQRRLPESAATARSSTSRRQYIQNDDPLLVLDGSCTAALLGFFSRSAGARIIAPDFYYPALCDGGAYLTVHVKPETIFATECCDFGLRHFLVVTLESDDKIDFSCIAVFSGAANVESMPLALFGQSFGFCTIEIELNFRGMSTCHMIKRTGNECRVTRSHQHFGGGCRITRNDGAAALSEISC
ncbi:MAG: hypothetical protein H6R01_27 [Burkholderiaceae bacterium]|nr:hypothetical protein [Burkholderiaceae bacterium]